MKFESHYLWVVLAKMHVGGVLKMLRRFLSESTSATRFHVVSKGTGSHPILCIPGALGTAVTDFDPQLKHFGQEESGFTIVSFDPAGYGKSRPPNRVFPTKPVTFFQQDAIDGHQVMMDKGFNQYSVLGWSDGGVAGMFLAAMFPDNVKNLVIWGANSYITEQDIELFEKTRDATNWSKKMRESLDPVYGAELGPMWSNWVDSMVELFNRDNGNICDDKLSLIKCPTLIVHGDKDPLVPMFHPKHLQKSIANASLYSFPDGKHNVHLRYNEDFNRIVQEFLIK